MRAPSTVSERQLRELSIRAVVKDQK
jgi:hypothetical protein